MSSKNDRSKHGPWEEQVKHEILRACQSSRVGLTYQDGTLSICKDIFMAYYPLLVTESRECGGWFTGSLKPQRNGDSCTLKLERARLFPEECWADGFLDIPPLGTATRERRVGMWHSHPHGASCDSRTPDVYSELEVIAVRKSTSKGKEVTLTIISRVPFSKIILLPSRDRIVAGRVTNLGGKEVYIMTGQWNEIVDSPDLRTIGEKRFVLPSVFRLDTSTHQVYYDGKPTVSSRAR